MTAQPRNSKGLHGKLLVITGGGSGIGRETALTFARCGAEVVLSDVNVDAAKQTAR
ncbi:MAG: SDR family NAD(P)-dependent oxidoreductase [Mycobacterium sp.]